MMTIQPIQRTLRRVRSRLARLTLARDLMLAMLLLAALFTTAVWYERQLYLATTIRSIIILLLSDFLLLMLLVVVIRGLGTWRGWWKWAQLDAIAYRMGNRLGLPDDRLLNALQLERRLTAPDALPNADLTEKSVRLVAQRLAEFDFGYLTPRRYKPPLRLAAIVIVVLAVAWLTSPRSMSHAVVRLMDPETEYPVPTPFILVSLSGDLEVLGGDTTEVVFTAVGSVPPATELLWEDHQGLVHSASMALHNGRYSYRFENIHDDIRYYARFVNRAWFSPWEKIKSQVHRISIIDRPVIEELKFMVFAPEYTGEPTEELGGNIADISALIGSRIELNGSTNLRLDSASMFLGEGEFPLPVNNKSFQGEFQLIASTEMTISIIDRRGITNTNPIRYTFTAVPDYPPTLSMILPLVAVDLDEYMLVPVHFDVSDDFGFSLAQISYEIIHPEYLSQDQQTYTHTIPELLLDKRSQRITHAWELASLNLVPGDEVRFQVEIYDNNTMTGPGKVVSRTMVARVPTLEELFARLSNSSDETTAMTEGVLEDLEDVRKLLEEMELAFRQDEQITWDQQQKGRKVLETLEEVLEAMESVQEQLQDLGSMADDNNLFGDEILEKYDELQNLLEEIITPELEDAMAQLREALEKIDPEMLKQALQNMQFEANEFEAQLDRFLDIFRLALAEMKMDEVVQRLERMVAVEEALLEKVTGLEAETDMDPGEISRKLQDVEGSHEQQERALEATADVMRDASQAVAPYSARAARDMEGLSDSDLMEDTGSDLRDGTQALKDRELASSKSEMETGRDNLQALLNEATAIRDQFQREAVTEMQARFQRVMSGVLALSKQQETLWEETKRLPNNSPRVREAAEQQHMLVKSMSQLIEQLVALSQQSFHITPEMGRSIGQANAAMNEAVSLLEANDLRATEKTQQQGMSALNEAAVALNNAMATMEQSGSASGYEQFLERMQNLTQGQQGLNQQTLNMQLGQMAGMSRIEMMRRLQARQRQLSQVLEQMLEDYPTQGGGKQGGLGRALEDMEEIIKDFQRRRITRRTTERQERIVTRLLDSQKSLTIQDFKEERRGEAPAQRYMYMGPSGLPDNLGEREDMLLQAMEKALRSGYSQDYQVVIQNYFQRLISGNTLTE
ncbi:DUF4175 family protein [Candidatus Neomarinimicrobiota bacterium]